MLFAWWNTYFGLLRGPPSSKPSSSNHKHRELVVAHKLVAVVGVHCKAAQMIFRYIQSTSY